MIQFEWTFNTFQLEQSAEFDSSQITWKYFFILLKLNSILTKSNIGSQYKHRGNFVLNQLSPQQVSTIVEKKTARLSKLFRPTLTSCAVLHVKFHGLTLISKPKNDCPSHFAFSPVSIVFDQFLTSFLTSLARMYEQSLINRYYALAIPPVSSIVPYFVYPLVHLQEFSQNSLSRASL